VPGATPSGAVCAAAEDIGDSRDAGHSGEAAGAGAEGAGSAGTRPESVPDPSHLQL